MKTNQKTAIAIYGVAATILAIPLIAMQFTKEVNWDYKDFIAMGILLFSTASVVDIILKKKIHLKKKVFYVAIALFFLMLVWIELAVGIFASPFAGS